jgi:sulfide:quinone oxidoreductase
MEHHEVLVVGAGNAGISLAARLLRDGVPSVTIVDARPVHRYRPLLNYVGGGQATMADLTRPMRDVIPDGCAWIRDTVVAVDPTTSTVRTRGERTLHYSTLVLCPGLAEDWDATPGLRTAYAEGWAASTYVTGATPLVWPALKSLRTGSVVFTVPPEPASCAATALKPLFLACDHWRRTGVLPHLDVRLVLPGPSVVALPAADETLRGALDTYGVGVMHEAQVASVDADGRGITIASPAGSQVLDDLTFAHVVPHYRAPRWIEESGLAVESASGLIDIDPETLRHRRHQSIWALGDAANVETWPSGGALRPQVDILSHNLAASVSGEPMRRYDGYTVMPITVSRRTLMLLEVDRDGRPAPSVPVIDLTKPRRSTWLFDRYGLPVTYFRRLLKGKV